MRYTNLPAQPATEGPDVVYTDGSFVAYANGQRIDGFANSQDAWSAARAAVFAPVAPASDSLAETLATAGQLAQVAYDAGFKAGKQATWQAVRDFCEQFNADETPSAPVIAAPQGVTVERDAPWTSYEHGDYYISVHDDGRMIEPDGNVLTPDDLAAMRAVLNHPDLTNAPRIVVTTELQEDDESGRVWGTDYIYGADSAGYKTRVYIPLADTPDDDRPALYAFGCEGWPLDEVERVLPQIIALLNSPEVQTARAQFKTQQDASRQMRRAA